MNSICYSANNGANNQDPYDGYSCTLFNDLSAIVLSAIIAIPDSVKEATLPPRAAPLSRIYLNDCFLE